MASCVTQSHRREQNGRMNLGVDGRTLLSSWRNTGVRNDAGRDEGFMTPGSLGVTGVGNRLGASNVGHGTLKRSRQRSQPVREKRNSNKNEQS